MSYSITLPWPDARLSPNSRTNWHIKAKLVASHREYARLMAYGCPEFPHGQPFSLCLYFYPPDRRHRDLDNCYSMCKAYQDGICDALGINDSAIQWVELRFCRVQSAGQVKFIFREEI